MSFAQRSTTYARMSVAFEFSHVIFDLDGVLLIRSRSPAATQAVVGEFGKTFDWALKSKMMGRHELDAARDLVETLSLPISAEEYLRRQLPIASTLFRASREIPGAESFVRSLAERRMPIAIGTSSSLDLFHMKTSHHAWFSLFAAVVSGDHADVHALKPRRTSSWRPPAPSAPNPPAAWSSRTPWPGCERRGRWDEGHRDAGRRARRCGVRGRRSGRVRIC